MFGTEKEKNRNKIRKHFYLSGRVQGVGFRYRSYHTASGLGLTGWDRNLEDGRVELELQGEEAEIKEFFKRLEKGSFIRIDHFEERRMEPAAEYGFEIREDGV